MEGLPGCLEDCLDNGLEGLLGLPGRLVWLVGGLALAGWQACGVVSHARRSREVGGYIHTHTSAGITNDKIHKKTFDPHPDGIHEVCKKYS